MHWSKARRTGCYPFESIKSTVYHYAAITDRGVTAFERFMMKYQSILLDNLKIMRVISGSVNKAYMYAYTGYSLAGYISSDATQAIYD
jgi:hypothetical protein